MTEERQYPVCYRPSCVFGPSGGPFRMHVLLERTAAVGQLVCPNCLRSYRADRADWVVVVGGVSGAQLAVCTAAGPRVIAGFQHH